MREVDQLVNNNISPINGYATKKEVFDLKKQVTDLSQETEEKLNKVFQSVSNGKQLIETTIIDKGFVVSKQNNIPTFSELSEGIKNIPVSIDEDIEGKKILYEVLIQKIPSLKDKLTLNSPFSLFAHYFMLIGPINFKIKENVNINIKAKKQSRTTIDLSNLKENIRTTKKEYDKAIFSETLEAIKIRKKRKSPMVLLSDL